MIDIAGFYTLLGGAFLGLLGFILFLSLFGLPANWIILGLIALWGHIFPCPDLSFWFWTFAIGMAMAGEIAEYSVQLAQGRRHGGSGPGNFAGIIGAIAGAILLAPLFWGLGAFIGALAGAFGGCLIVELLRGRCLQAALSAAFGAMLGRFLGSIFKISAGVAIIAAAGKSIWPEFGPAASPLPPTLIQLSFPHAP